MHSLVLRLQGALFLGIIGTGVLGVLATPEAFAPLPEGPRLLDGSLTRAWEQRLDDELVLGEVGITSWAVVELGLFGDPRPGALLGEHGWLFSDEELHTAEGGAAVLPAHLDLIVGVAQHLADRGIALDLVLVPAKARIYDDYLGGHALPAQVQGRYRTVRERLAPHLDVVDLAHELREERVRHEVFLRTDTHWTPAGAWAVARALAGGSAGGGGEWREQAGPTVLHEGDLTRFVPLGPLQEAWGFAPEPVATRTAHLVGSSASPGLFDEVAIPVVLVGTSYSAQERWGFADALRVALQQDVLVAAVDGEGPFLPMLRLLEGDTLETTAPTRIVWELPERYLAVDFDSNLVSDLDALRLELQVTGRARRDRATAASDHRVVEAAAPRRGLLPSP